MTFDFKNLTGKTILTDGAWGTQLQKQGLTPGSCPDACNLNNPAAVLAVARSYVEVGSQVILTNTVGANRITLAKHQQESRVREINKAGARISKEAAGGKALVFASIGPTGKMVMMGEVKPEELFEAFKEQAEALAEGLPKVELAHKALGRAVAHWPDAAPDQDRLRSAVLELDDLLALAQDQALRWAGAGADRIELMEARLALYERLARRHRCEPEELTTRAQAFREEQRLLLAGDASVKELEGVLAKVAEAYRAAAEALHGQRSEALPRLEAEVQKRLARLGMKGARLQLRLALAEEAGSPVEQGGRPVRVAAQGFSALAIWIEPNPGEGFRPLARIASGGELSRLMLALVGAGLALGAGVRDGLTLVLDEVDAGLGGETALAVGKAVAELGRAHQVLAVTHLAQVAARADRHGCLSKETEGGRTRSALGWVVGEARTRELARLLSGHPDRIEALDHARVLLEG